MHVRSKSLLVIAGTLLAVAVGCGGESSETPAPAKTPEPAATAPAPVDTSTTTTTVVSTTTTSSPTDAPGASGAMAPAAAAVTLPAGTPAPGEVLPQAAIDEAHQIFTVRCSVCHGMGGKGDGIGSAALNPKPQNYTDPAWQAKVADAEIEKAILEGGAAVGRSPLMVPNPDLKDKPDVVKGLRQIVRGFAAK